MSSIEEQPGEAAEQKRETPRDQEVTVGRVVYYRAGEYRTDVVDNDRHRPPEERQPMRADVCYVHRRGLVGPQLVYLSVTDHAGNSVALTSVRFIQPSEPPPTDQFGYAHWMPFQVKAHAAPIPVQVPEPLVGGGRELTGADLKTLEALRVPPACEAVSHDLLLGGNNPPIFDGNGDDFGVVAVEFAISPKADDPS